MWTFNSVFVTNWWRRRWQGCAASSTRGTAPEHRQQACKQSSVKRVDLLCEFVSAKGMCGTWTIRHVDYKPFGDTLVLVLKRLDSHKKSFTHKKKKRGEKRKKEESKKRVWGIKKKKHKTPVLCQFFVVKSGESVWKMVARAVCYHLFWCRVCNDVGVLKSTMSSGQKEALQNGHFARNLLERRRCSAVCAHRVLATQ